MHCVINNNNNNIQYDQMFSDYMIFEIVYDSENWIDWHYHEYDFIIKGKIIINDLVINIENTLNIDNDHVFVIQDDCKILFEYNEVRNKILPVSIYIDMRKYPSLKNVYRTFIQ